MEVVLDRVLIDRMRLIRRSLHSLPELACHEDGLPLGAAWLARVTLRTLQHLAEKPTPVEK